MKNEFKWAVIMSVVLLVWLTLLKFLGFQEADKADLFVIVVNAYYLLLFGMYLLAINERRRKQNGYITRRDAFLTGLLVTLFLVVLSPLNMAIFYYLINPNFFDVMIAVSIENGVSEQVAQGDYNLYSYIFSSIVMNLVAGGVFSALGAVLLQKIPNKQQYEPLA
jgi:glucose uptake protein GlcU